MVGEEVKMVDRDGVVRRQRWCGEEVEMVWGGGRMVWEEAEVVWGGGRDGVGRR